MHWFDPWVTASLAAVLGILAGLWAARRWRGVRARRRFERGAQAERDAVELLKAAGYRVLDEQIDGTWTLRVDGEDRRLRVRADLLVARRGRRYVAEVKSGESASRATSRETRRQLLEYALAFEVDRVLLVDMEAGRVRQVGFQIRPARAGRFLLAGLVLGTLAGLALERYFGVLAGWIR